MSKGEQYGSIWRQHQRCVSARNLSNSVGCILVLRGKALKRTFAAAYKRGEICI